jgi:hypothetical protein
MSRDEQRYILWMPGAPGWKLPPATSGRATGGGHLVMHELAVAIAATGRRVEVRGQFDFDELRALSDAAGATPELATEPHKPETGDVVVMPEGLRDPLDFGVVALSRARRILLVLAPPGLLGWPFVEGWRLRAAVDVKLDEVARPEHFKAMAAMGFELWANSPALVERIKAAGVRGTWIGKGRPMPFPEPLPKRYDVVTLAHNRWSELAAEVVGQLDPSVVHYRIPASPHEEVLRRFGEARVLVHPLRVEGDSRIGQEARAMGAVPVVLNTNPFSVGLDEESGAVSVARLEEMPDAVTRLLADPQRLADLRERGMRCARRELNWEQHLKLVDAALRVPPLEDPAAQARALIGDALDVREQLINGSLSWERELVADLERVKGALEDDRAALAEQLDQAKATIQEVRSTRVWRLALAFWRIRDRLQRRAR